MPQLVEIDDQLVSLVERLSALRMATPRDDPQYATITEQYRDASDRQTEAISKAIYDNDKDYTDFSNGIQMAIKSINDTLNGIKKVSETIIIVAKVLDIVGKVIAQLVAIG